MKQWKWAAVAASCAIVLAGCGGASDGSNTTPKTVAPSVKVFGDSIMDSGTFGYKFTIQSADAANPFLIFPEVVAANFGVSKLCAFFNFNGTTFVPNTSCTSFAVGGGRVNNLTNASAPSNAVPFSITYQMSVGSATLAASDLVIVDGGGNDLADLTGAYLGATTPAGVATFVGLLSTLLPPATVSALVGATPTATSMGTAAGAYAQAVGQTLAAAVKTNIVAKGVNKVVVVNAPDITVTPRFMAVLSAVAASSGTAQRDAVQAAVRAWTAAMNSALAQGLAGTNVQLYDLNTEGGKISANPAQFALTNITTPACPKVAGGLDSTTGQASLSLAPTVAACNSASMSANIPVGETSANWWKSYAYSDNFHPTPALHQLIGQSINLQLAKAGWL
ncbi:MAG: phospholipase [Burkholderiales bacterium]|nr:phospholipase [Burkholderiales bacterium]